MSIASLAWLVLQSKFCAKSHRQGSSLNDSEAHNLHRITDAKPCVFCQASSSNRHAFNIVWEDAEFLAFRDRRPASVHHILLIPKVHISSVKKLTRRDSDMVRRMETIGNDILDKFQIPLTHRKMGFHIPPFCSVQHLHLHVQALPYISFVRQLKYSISRGFGTFDKGFSWFAERLLALLISFAVAPRADSIRKMSGHEDHPDRPSASPTQI